MALLARDMMQAEVVTVEPTLPAVELGRLLDRERISGAPVVDNGRLVGVVSRADLSRALAEARDQADATLEYYRDVGGALRDWGGCARLAGELTESLRVRDFMSTNLVTVAPTQPLRDVANTLAMHGIHRVLVAEDRRLLGLISSLDLVRLAAEGRLVEGRE